MDLNQNSAIEPGHFSYRERHAHRHDVLQRLVGGSGSLLISMLGIRFTLALLGANPINGFANFVYGFTSPFTSPFYNLFSYDHPTIGISTFEGYTLISIAVYALVMVALIKLVSITRY
jgi:hypothetical protein